MERGEEGKSRAEERLERGRIRVEREGWKGVAGRDN